MSWQSTFIIIIIIIIIMSASQNTCARETKQTVVILWNSEKVFYDNSVSKYNGRTNVQSSVASIIQKSL